MKQKLLALFLSVFLTNYLNVCLLSAQNSSPFYDRMHFVNEAQKPEVKDNMPSYLSTVLAKAKEDISKRTLHSSTFLTDDGQYITQYSQQIVNYYNDENNLVPVRIELHNCSRGWVADQQPYPCYFHLNRSTAISLDNGNELVFNANSKVNGIEYSQQLLSVNKTEVNLNLSDDIHKKITFLTNGIETDYTIDKPIGTSLEVTEGIDFPEGCTFVPDTKRGNKKEGMWQGDYVLLSSDGKEISRFHAPVIYDATNKNWCMGYYRVEVKDGKRVLHTVVPDAWLSKAKYPVTIDPVVMGPVARWPLSRNIPSGYWPSFVTDSIQVTIPGGITITRFYVSYCFQSNLANHIPFKDGRIFFKTPCDSTPLLECDTSGLPGYCYVDTLGNRNDFGPSSPYFRFPLTCCFNPSCSIQKFYLTVGLSRNCPLCLPKKPDSTNWLWTPCSPTPFPFYAYIVGNTDQVNSWSVTPTKVCSNQCDITLNINAEYGVPPYTATHPWAAGKTVFGTAVPCNQSTGVVSIPLTIPGCPTSCGTTTTLTVPPPVVYDVCGDTVKGLKASSITINPVPEITTKPDSETICSGSPINLTISSCVAGATINWTGSDKSSGTGSIGGIGIDTTGSPISIVYTATCSYNGCVGDTSKSYVKIIPSPTVTAGRDTTIYPPNSVSLFATGGTSYSWFPTIGLSCSTCPNPVATPSVSTTYYVTVSNSFGCSRLDSVTIIVLDQPITIPNVFTPNGDGINDAFAIGNIDFYPNSKLDIFNRWGVKVFTSSNYHNEWAGGTQNDGVYYYVLTLPNGKKYQGYLELIKSK